LSAATSKVCETVSLSVGSEIDDQIKLARLLDRQFARLRTRMGRGTVVESKPGDFIAREARNSKFLDETPGWTGALRGLAVRYRNQPQLMVRFFKDLERLAYSLLVIKAGINNRIDRFSKLTKSI
jgi:hypothetical protein